MHPKIILEIEYLKKLLSKILSKFNFIFYGIYYEKQKYPRTNYQPLLRLLNIFRSFWCLNSKRFLFFPKISNDNLCQPFHVVIIITLFAFSWSDKGLDKKEENFKKIEHWKKQKSVLLEIKSIVHNFKGFLWWNIKY